MKEGIPEKDLLAFRIMAYLNKKHRHYGGLFQTPYGILRLWFGGHGWLYEYCDIEILPEEIIWEG